MFIADIDRKRWAAAAAAGGGKAPQSLLDTTLWYADSALAIDSFSVTAWWEKGVVYKALADTAGVIEVTRHLRRIAPWLVNP